jgi:hypothetical protein
VQHILRSKGATDGLLTHLSDHTVSSEKTDHLLVDPSTVAGGYIARLDGSLGSKRLLIWQAIRAF